MIPFGPDYAGLYDSLYQDKDYAAECALVEDLLKRFSEKKPLKILDLGCGTGRHAALFAQHGFQVTAVDRSAAMIKIAREKSPKPVSFHQSEIENLDLGQTFDACVMLFAVFSYLTEDRVLEAALQNVRRHLKPGGLFLFDFWSEEAVLAEPPSNRSKEMPCSGGRVEREATTLLREKEKICEIHYRFRKKEGTRVLLEGEERHRMRYFSRPEVSKLLQSQGFEPVASGGFPDFEAARPVHWSLLQIARPR